MASLDQETLYTAGMNLVAELWTNDIKAELAVEATTHEQVSNQHRNESFGWVVTIKQSSTTSGERNIRVRNLVKKEEIDVRQADLVTHLLLEIGEREKKEIHNERHRVQRQTSNSEVNQKAKDYDDMAGVTVLQSNHRGRKVNRRNVVDGGKSLFPMIHLVCTINLYTISSISKSSGIR